MSDKEIEAKTRQLAGLGGSGVDVDAVIETVWSLDRLADVGSLMRLAAGSGAGLP